MSNVLIVLAMEGADRNRIGSMVIDIRPMQHLCEEFLEAPWSVERKYDFYFTPFLKKRNMTNFPDMPKFLQEFPCNLPKS